jgi:excisionase family DNA binding protein
VNELGLLTTKEAADLLRLSPSALQKLRMDGSLPFLKLGGKVFFKKETLAKYVEDQQLVYPPRDTGDQ